MRFVSALAVVLALLAAPAPAAAEPVPVERFFQHPALLDAQLSPSGRRLALASRGVDRVGLMVFDLEGRAKLRWVANFNDADVTRFDWVNDERLVFAVVDLQSGSEADRRLAPGLFSVRADGAELRRLVRRGGRAVVTDGSERADTALDWNHVLLHVPAPQQGAAADDVVIGELMFGGGTQLRSLRPLWLDTRTGRTRLLPLGDAPAHVVRWWFDSKGEARLAQSWAEGRVALHWRGPGETRWRPLFDAEALALPFVPEAVADDGTLYVTTSEGPDERAVLTRFDFKTMAPAQPPLVRTTGFDFSGRIVQAPDGRALGVRVDIEMEQTVWFDDAMKAFQAEADRRLPGRVNRIECRRCGRADMVAVVRSYADRDPGQIVLYEGEGATKGWQRLSAVREGVDPRDMARVDVHRIRARDGREIPVWLTQPAGVPGRAVPAVVLVHGGPWVRGGRWAWEPMAQFLASRGYLVVSPDFRGSAGYGDAHLRAGFRQWGQAMQDDIADALLWAQAQGLADKRACIAGASYGGYAALMGLVRHPALYRCGVAWAAPTDLQLFLEGSFWIDDDIGREARRYTLPEMVGDPVKDAAMLKAVSPLAQAERIQAPLLLAYGEADRRVPLVHGERLRSALKAAGRPPEWVTYADEGHSWRLVATEVDFARRMEAFLARHLAPGPER